MGESVEGCGLRVPGGGLRVQGLGILTGSWMLRRSSISVSDLGSGVQGPGSRVQE